MVEGQLAAFLLGYAALAAAVARGRGPLFSIASMIGVYAVYTIASMGIAPLVSSLAAMLEWSNLSVFIYIFLSLALAGVLRETGKLDSIVDSTTRVGCRFSYIGVPAIIGLLPMPGGALVSAMAMKRRYIEESGMKPEWAAYLNYWFRHIWIPAWPLFQSIVITASVLLVEPGEVVRVTWPGTLAAIIAGLVVAYPALNRYRCRGVRRGGSLLHSVWPFILLAALVFSGAASLMTALIATLAAAILLLRPTMQQVKGALALAASPRIHGVLLEALLLKELLSRTGAPGVLYATAASMGAPEAIVVFMVPFILGLAAGGENFFAATAMPLLTGYLIEGPGLVDEGLLLLAYTGGMLGVMASPVHLCFALTVDYFKARPGRVMALTLASIILSASLVWLYTGLLL